MSKKPQPTHAFTIQSPAINRMLAMDITITPVNDTSKAFKTKGIWDTGATGTVITENVAKAIGLQPTGMTKVNTASETGRDTQTYLVDIFLKPDVRVHGIEVTCGTIDTRNGFDCLIGMDIITMGDFAITNLDSKTCMSFRIPSQHRVDFVEVTKRQSDRLVNPKLHSKFTPPKKKRK